MLDIQFIRDNAESVAEKSRQKGYDVDVQQLLGFDTERRELLQQVEDLRRQRNELSEQTKGQKPSDEQIARGRELRDQVADLEHKLASIDKEYEVLLKAIPNMPADDVPVGDKEEDNVVAKTVGDKPRFDFKPKEHHELAEPKDWIDKERAAKISGSRFAYLKGDLVRLQFAIIQWVLQTLGDEKVIQKLIDENDLDLPAKP
ncbi:MAG TPA: serine--tRNA ligase, partial [Candidatus Saccharimonadia bacterium]|nr:serine--tRNA ligase [Candidatus Saccharimonadia bacterium]